MLLCPVAYQVIAHPPSPRPHSYLSLPGHHTSAVNLNTMPFFANSQHATINGSNFVDQQIGPINVSTNVSNVTTNISPTNGQTGIDILLEASNPDAIHDSSARDYAPRCQPGTRNQYIEDTVRWGVPSMGADEPLPLFWMKGLAGVGKSAIAQTCAEEIKKLGRLGATFFFAVNIREDTEQFFPTIAYQLATEFPDYRDLLDQRIRHNRTILKKTMVTQFKALIAEPFQELEKAGKGIGRRMVIIIDGLDECKKADDQSRIIEIIAAAARDGVTPFCWAFFSRPEPHIEASFTSDDVAQATCMVLLPVSNDADSDIELYLRSGFKNTLRRRNIPMASQWPSDSDIQTLVKRSKGLFIYAAMVLRDVDQAGSPSEALRAICTATLDPTDSSLFAGLDAFYMLIMQRIPPEDLPTILFLCRLLCGAASYLGSGYTSGAMRLSNMLGLSAIDFWAICNQLSAVLHVHDHSDSFDFSQFGDTDHPFWHATPVFVEELRAHVNSRLGGAIHFYHKSFYDFLVDPTRSGPFYLWSPSVCNVDFKHYLDVTLKYEESYRFNGSDLMLAHGVADSAFSLSWPYTNELVNSILKARIYDRAFDACIQLGELPEIEHQLLQRFSRADFRKAQLNRAMLFAGHSGFLGCLSWGCDGHRKYISETQLFRIPRDEFRENFDVTRFKAAIKRWKECGMIQPYHPNLGSQLKSLITKKSRGKLISELFCVGHGPKSVFWYWEINLKEEYYRDFRTSNLVEGERIYREEKFDLWPTESLFPT
ncbi:hypothetical protein P691DRAFT_807829 [Macrolepiota fuliginosa MF-IS2]|uniref:Nephrocystin 3-like N-terminal domain-containing protein n=1 Tax=Macrolepiota fuliginosa MF-IS2 TaxID=1400762 RepID=A0A9P5XJE6_9AGAR|nr:hypothetical protein P691DRAFT_807829 [Macrolepiota fuliginosa MF-IS2]